MVEVFAHVERMTPQGPALAYHTKDRVPKRYQRTHFGRLLRQGYYSQGITCFFTDLPLYWVREDLIPWQKDLPLMLTKEHLVPQSHMNPSARKTWNIVPCAHLFNKSVGHMPVGIKLAARAMLQSLDIDRQDPQARLELHAAFCAWQRQFSWRGHYLWQPHMFSDLTPLQPFLNALQAIEDDLFATPESLRAQKLYAPFSVAWESLIPTP